MFFIECSMIQQCNFVFQRSIKSIKPRYVPRHKTTISNWYGFNRYILKKKYLYLVIKKKLVRFITFIPMHKPIQ